MPDEVTEAPSARDETAVSRHLREKLAAVTGSFAGAPPEEPELGRFEDHRGVIQDLITRRIDAITRITTRAGAVRGNHVHKRTVQYTYVVSGRMKFVTQPGCTPAARTEHVAGPGELIREEAGVPHAWQAIEDTTVLVFTRGPRSGDAYETDTERLEIPLL